MTLSLARLHQQIDSGQRRAIWNDFVRSFVTQGIGSASDLVRTCKFASPVVCWLLTTLARASSPMASARHHLVLPELRKFAHLKSFAHARDSPTLRQPCHAAIHSSGDKCIRMQRLPNLLATFREGCAVGHLLSGSA